LCYNFYALGLLAWIRKIQYALHECAESIRNAQNRKKEQHLPPDKPMEVRAVVSYDESTVRDAKADSKRSHDTQQSIKKATWAGFVAVFLYAIVTAFMWRAMIEQNKIATIALNQSTQSFRLDERAWVEIEPIKPVLVAPADSKFSATFTCDIYPKNVGKTVAKDIVVKASDFGGREPTIEEMNNMQDKLLLDKFTEMGTGKPVVIPRNPVPKTLAPNSSSPVPFRLTCQAPQIFSNGTQALHLMVGRIDYCDQFQIRHWNKFCFYVVNGRGEVWACKEGNDEDRNPETLTPENACGKPN
jgi:hypothetical protein